MLVANALSYHRLGGGEVGTGVHADTLLRIVGEMDGHALPLATGLSHEVREEDLAGVVRAEPLDRDTEPAKIRRVGAEVRLLELFLLARGKARLDDARDVPSLVADHAPVRVIRPDLAGEEHKRCVALPHEGTHAGERLRAQERRVAIDDESHAAVAIRGGERNADGVAGAARDVLNREACPLIEELACRGALFREDHQRPRTGGPHGPQDVRDKWTSGDGVEHLRSLGLHPRREARREHYRQRRLAHGGLRQAGAPGFEPGIADPKSAALPLGHAPQDTAKRIGAVERD